jgi:hypothetical protein
VAFRNCAKRVGGLYSIIVTGSTNRSIPRLTHCLGRRGCLPSAGSSGLDSGESAPGLIRVAMHVAKIAKQAAFAVADPAEPNSMRRRYEGAPRILRTCLVRSVEFGSQMAREAPLRRRSAAGLPRRRPPLELFDLARVTDYQREAQESPGHFLHAIRWHYSALPAPRQASHFVWTN